VDVTGFEPVTPCLQSVKLSLYYGDTRLEHINSPGG
jgi:hypothetical protein